jgi:hypothetical protein
VKSINGKEKKQENLHLALNCLSLVAAVDLMILFAIRVWNDTTGLRRLSLLMLATCISTLRACGRRLTIAVLTDYQSVALRTSCIKLEVDDKKSDYSSIWLFLN